jgi:hypothetical protein
MIAYQIELLHPEAQALLDSLVKLKLIRLHNIEPSKAAFWELVEQLRSQKSETELSEDEIAREVEAVRTARYERKTQSHH